jgi:hypothetical protein
VDGEYEDAFRRDVRQVGRYPKDLALLLVVVRSRECRTYSTHGPRHVLFGQALGTKLSGIRGCWEEDSFVGRAVMMASLGARSGQAETESRVVLSRGNLSSFAQVQGLRAETVK